MIFPFGFWTGNSLLPFFAQGVTVGNLSTSFPEPSGLARPNEPANSGHLWFEQDGGGPNAVTLLNVATGAAAGSWTLEGVAQVDAEDLASARIGGVNYLYYADIGDNGSARATTVIYRCIEPAGTGSDGTILSGNIHAITCQFPGGNTPAHKDCECLLVDPDNGTIYYITKRIFPAKIYSLAHAASYVGTQTLVYEGMVAADTSTTSFLIGTGSKLFTTVSSLAFPIGIRLRAASAANAANFMEGDVTAVAGNQLTINVDAVGGSGTLADWQVSLATSKTRSGNNGCITGGSISPNGGEIVLCGYGYPAPGAAGKGSSGAFLFRRDKATQTIPQALAAAPLLITGDTGGGIFYPHTNPPSFPQREAIEFANDSRSLYTLGEFIAGEGGTANPLVQIVRLSKAPTTRVLQQGLNGYAGQSDTYIGHGTPTTDNSAAVSLVADIDFSGTALTISNIASFNGGAEIELTVSALTGVAVGFNVTVYNCSAAQYNGTWICSSTATTPNRIRLKRAFAVGAVNGTCQGHSGATADRQILLKFSDLSGIPAGARIVGAKLVIYVNTEGKSFSLHRMLLPWTHTSTWASLADGVTKDDVEAAVLADAEFAPPATDTYVGFLTLNLPVSTIQNWTDGVATNYGWVITGHDGDLTGDGLQMDSAEGATQARKPMLIINHV